MRNPVVLGGGGDLGVLGGDLGLPGVALSPLAPEFGLIHRPYGPTDVLHPHKAFVQAQVAAHCILRGGAPPKK